MVRWLPPAPFLNKNFSGRERVRPRGGSSRIPQGSRFAASGSCSNALFGQDGINQPGIDSSSAYLRSWLVSRLRPPDLGRALVPPSPRSTAYEKERKPLTGRRLPRRLSTPPPLHHSLESSGLRPLRFYDLRHTVGSLAINRASIVQVQGWMGHADVDTRAATYTTSHALATPNCSPGRSASPRRARANGQPRRTPNATTGAHDARSPDYASEA